MADNQKDLIKHGFDFTNEIDGTVNIGDEDKYSATSGTISIEVPIAGKKRSMYFIIFVCLIGIPSLILLYAFNRSGYNNIREILMIILIVTNIGVIGAVFLEKVYADKKSDATDDKITDILIKSKVWDKRIAKIDKVFTPKAVKTWNDGMEYWSKDGDKIKSLLKALEGALKDTDKLHYIDETIDIDLTKARLIELIEKIEVKMKEN